MMKKFLSLFLAVLMTFSVLTVAVCAADTMPMELYDLLKVDVDTDSGICRTVMIFFRNQLRNYDADKQIAFLNENGSVAAVCVPRADNNRILDLYAPDDTFGVTLDPTRLYFLTVEEGAYYTDDGVLCAAYRGEYNGLILTSADKNYTVKDLGIYNFAATKYDDAKVYAGKLFVDSTFTDYQPGNNTVTLFKINGSAEEKLGDFHIVGYKNGVAELDFGTAGVEINKYADYKLRVEYGSLIAKGLICGHSDYALSGKKLLNQREDYPAIDLLIKLFGADHKIVGFIPTVLKILSKIKLVDTALYKDIEKYIKAKKAK